MKRISTLIDRAGDRLYQQIRIRPPAIFSGIASVSIASLFLCGIGISKPNPAFAASGTCKDVQITLKNASNDTIKVTKFEYKDVDENKFRTELILGINGKEFINPRKSVAKVRDLGKINRGDLTSFRVTYEKKIGGTKFEAPIIFTTEEFACKFAHTVELK
jgi:hypothetical protein